MAQVSLQGSRIMARIREGIAAGMPKHMGVNLSRQLCRAASALYHSTKARCVQRGTAFRDKDKLPGGLVSLMLAQCPQLSARQGVR